MSTDSEDSDGLMPEEVMKGLGFNTREIYSNEELAEFLREWSDQSGFAEELEDLVDSFRRPEASPEEIFEHLASNTEYSVEEILDKAEELGDGEWGGRPVVSGTGGFVEPSFEDKVSAPREDWYLPLSADYVGESKFSDSGKDVWLQQHEDGWFQTEVESLTMDEFRDFFADLERMAPAKPLHEAVYGNRVYFINSEDLEYFFEFENDIDDFDKQIYRIESEFDDFMMEASLMPGEDERYRVMLFSRDGETYPLKAYNTFSSDQLIKGIETRLGI